MISLEFCHSDSDLQVVTVDYKETSKQDIAPETNNECRFWNMQYRNPRKICSKILHQLSICKRRDNLGYCCLGDAEISQ